MEGISPSSRPLLNPDGQIGPANPVGHQPARAGGRSSPQAGFLLPLRSSTERAANRCAVFSAFAISTGRCWALVLLLCTISVFEIYSATLHTKYAGFHTKQFSGSPADW